MLLKLSASGSKLHDLIYAVQRGISVRRILDCNDRSN